MAKITVDIDKEGVYNFAVRRDTNRTIATCTYLANKGKCMEAITLFQEFANDSFYWNYKRSPVANYHYADWEKNGVVVRTKRYNNRADLNKALNLIKSEVSAKTPIYHTIIKNENYAR